MTEAIEATAPVPDPALDPAPVEVKTRSVVWPIIITMLTLTAVVFGIAYIQGSYENQFGTVEKLEAAAQTINTTPAGSAWEATPAAQAFLHDPLVNTDAWTAYVQEVGSPGGVPAPTDASIMKDRAASVWWPGLADRAQKAVTTMKYSPDWYSYMALTRAADTVIASCNTDRPLTVDQRIQKWTTDHDANKNTNGQDPSPAQRAVMPAVFRAGVPIFCK